MKLTKKQLENLAKILSDMGKLIFAIVVLGPLVKPEGFDIPKLIFGMTVCLILFVLSLNIDKGE